MNHTVRTLRRAGQVRRLHTVRTVEEHTIGRHVYGSQVVALWLLDKNPDCQVGNVLRALLLHDAPEVDTGDTPAPAKRASPMLNAALDKAEREFFAQHRLEFDLSEREEMLVKACDIIDLGLACVEEMELGNQTSAIRTVWLNVIDYLEPLRVVYGVTEAIQYLKGAHNGRE